MSMLAALLTLGAIAGAFAWFVRLERTDRAVTVVMALLWLIIIDAAVYQSQNLVPAGILHPEIGPLSFRPLDLTIPVALAARLYAGGARGVPTWIDRGRVLWTATLVWLGAASLTGLWNGNSLGLVAFEAKVVVYMALAFLAAGVPFERYLERARLQRLFGGTAAIAVFLLVLDAMSVRLTTNLPLLPLSEFGVMGSDAATIFVTIGLVALAVGLFVEEGRFTFLLPAAALLASPLASNQRAAILGLLVGLAVIAGCLLISRRTPRITPVEGLVAAGVVAACLLIPVVLQFSAGQGAGLPLQSELTAEFGGYESVLTDQVRQNQWSSVQALIAERPLFGWGLGKEFVFFEPGFGEFQEFYSVHNVGGDLLLRAGAVGLGLFLVSLGVTAWGALVVLSRARDDVLAVTTAALLAGVAGLLSKGMVEDLFEKYRLAALLGLLIGQLLSATAAVAYERRKTATKVRRQIFTSNHGDQFSM